MYSRNLKFICKRCNRIFKSKNGLKYHIKKNVCGKNNLNYNLNKNINDNHNKIVEYNKNNTIRNKNDNENNNDNFNCNSKYYCKFCNKTYKHSSSFYRHKSSGICNKRQNELVLFNERKDDDFFKEFQQFTNNNYNSVSSKDRNINTKINIEGDNNKIMYTNVVNNNNFHINNVIVNSYGQENTKYITSKVIKEIIHRFAPENVIPKVIEYKNFNHTHPENHNIVMTNIKEKRIKAKIGNQMRSVDRDQLYQYSINKTDRFIKEKLDEIDSSELKSRDQNSIYQYKIFFNKLIKDIEKYKTGSYKRKNEYMKQKKLLDNIIITFRELEKRLKDEQMELELKQQLGLDVINNINTDIKNNTDIILNI